METPRILVVDDEPVVLEVVERYLQREGFAVSTAPDGVSAMAAFSETLPHLVVLDLMLPRLSGMEVCQRIREVNRTPIIMLTARGDEMDRIAGFDRGADDYLAKPFSPRELVARVKAVLRRSYETGDLSTGERVSSSGISVDPKSRRVEVRGAVVDLTAREFDLLHYLIAHPGQVFTREQLLDRVWNYEWFGDASTVTVHIRRLRIKVEVDPDSPVHVRTVWGVGYKWEP